MINNALKVQTVGVLKNSLPRSMPQTFYFLTCSYIPYLILDIIVEQEDSNFAGDRSSEKLGSLFGHRRQYLNLWEKSMMSPFRT